MIYFVYHRSRLFSQANFFTLVFFFRHTMCSILFQSLILLFEVRFSNGHSSCRGQTHFRQKHSLPLFSFICVIRWPSLIRFFCQWTSIKAWTGHVQLITNMSSQYRCSTQFRWTLSWRSRSHVEVTKSFASVVSQVTGTIIFLFTSQPCRVTSKYETTQWEWNRLVRVTTRTLLYILSAWKNTSILYSIIHLTPMSIFQWCHPYLHRVESRSSEESPRVKRGKVALSIDAQKSWLIGLESDFMYSSWLCI